MIWIHHDPSRLKKDRREKEHNETELQRKDFAVHVLALQV